MTAEKNTIDEVAHLRRRAETIARGKSEQSPENLEALPQEEIRQMLHELRVHQIELEMQNEELRQMQTELDAARARYFELYDIAPVGYCTLSEKGLILEANLTAATLLGVARNALVKQPLSRYIFTEDLAHYYRYRKQLTETGEPQTCELRMLRLDGTQFWTHLEATVAQDTEGAAVSYVTMNDITARKQVELQLRASEERFRAAFESAAIGIEELDLEGHFLLGNPKLAEILGMSREEIYALTYTQITHPEDIAREQPLMDQLLAGERPSYTIEKRFLRRDGHPVWVRITSSLTQGAPQRSRISIIEDITERVKV